MAILSKTLASGPEGAWMIVFDQEELQLFVGFTEDGVPSDGMTVEDFLTTVPKSALHQDAQERFKELLRGLLA